MNQTSWPPLVKLHLISGGNVIGPPGTTFGPRLHPNFDLIWIRSGIQRVTINSRKFEGTAGTVFLLPPGVVDRHDASKKERIVLSFLHFNPGPIPIGWPPVSQWPLFRQLPAENALFQLFRLIMSCSPLDDKRFEPFLKPTIEVMLRLYLCGNFEKREAGLDSGLSAPVEKVIQWVKGRVEKYPSKKIHLQEMASQASVSAQHLCLLFKKDLQIRPMECARLLRTDLAGSMLERTRLTIKEISIRCGFENPFHFSRVFRGIYGVPPQTYRKGYLDGTLFRPGSPLFRKHDFHRLLINNGGGITRPFELLPKRYRFKA